MNGKRVKSFVVSNKSWSNITSEDAHGRTMSNLLINVNGLNLTENFNTWSQTVEESVLVSSAPLAMWFMQSWWRLLYEPLQSYSSGKLDVEWRIAHEIGAVDSGYVWPRIAFISDLENVYIHARPTMDRNQSVRYINGTETIQSVSLGVFNNVISGFIQQVIDRLDGLGEMDTTIKDFWEIILEERSNPEIAFYRKVEAMLGYDPDEANKQVMDFALHNFERIGEHSLEELAPVYGRLSKNTLLDVEEFFTDRGVLGNPQIASSTPGDFTIDAHQPWKQATRDAKIVREKIDLDASKPIESNRLLDLLGVASCDRDKWAATATGSQNASVGVTDRNKGQIRYVPRKTNLHGGRFEMARFLGDHLTMQGSEWLVGADTHTVRQKYQRAFAAELLCPIDGLTDFLQGDFSTDRQLDAAEHFQVGERVVSSILANTGFVELSWGSEGYYAF